ncbi:MAG: YjfB family protein [Chloroflexi bacterium]|nr:YjfB family protein [Chloroflexota bacterium]
MDVSAAASGTSAMDLSSLKDQASIAVLRQSMNVEQTAALELIQSIQAPQPSHLGGNVDLLA